MANSDDPPFLSVGTEVSAKYRGAFCEATIKIAKKLIKCKVSYSKGQSGVVSDDAIKGTLKVGVQVDVKQPDGQVLSASIVKLTDQTTYTVVFDDGDERTLKRSSLCLKGGRHFDKSESLDHLPLTDPENFGTPVILPKKTNRRRCRPTTYGGGLGSGGEEGESRRKKMTYPPEFPVGKTVFLENDRRRACWLPAVIVPAHYVLEECDMKPDTICLRSFKDGRFFAATKNELHEFSPTKEPLLSMLEGEIQTMYMCKPAIERAMVFLDTGELPWGMDLFDGQADRQGGGEGVSSAGVTSEGVSSAAGVTSEGVSSTAGVTSEGVSSAAGVTSEGVSSSAGVTSEENQQVNKDSFMDRLKRYHESKGTPLTRVPILAQKDLDLCRLYHLVQENGGMDRVTQEMKWRSLYLQLGMTLSTNASHAIKQAYRRYLNGFEAYEKGKGKAVPPKDSPGRGRKRAAAAAVVVESEEEPESRVQKAPKLATPEKHPIKSEVLLERVEHRTTRLSKQQTSSKELRADSWRGEPRDSKPHREIPTPFFSSPTTASTSPSSASPSSASPFLPSFPGSRVVVRDPMSGGRGEGRGDVRSSPRSHGLREMKLELVEDGKRSEKAESPASMSAECKSELSDHESSQGDTTSSTTGEEMDGGQVEDGSWTKRDCGEGFAENDRVLVWYGRGKNQRTYEAKVIGTEENERRREYLVHYSGWNNRYNEWIEESRIWKKITNPTKHARPQYSKKMKKVKQMAMSEDSPTPKRKPFKEMEGERQGEVQPPQTAEEREEDKVPRSLMPPSVPSPLEVRGAGVVSGSIRSPLRPPQPPVTKKKRLSTSNHLNSTDSSPSPPLISQAPPPAPPTTTTSVTTATAALFPPDFYTHEIPSSTSPLPPPPSLSPLSSGTFTVTQTQVPPLVENAKVNGISDEAMEMGCAIEVKKEENASWLLSAAERDPHSDLLLCGEELLGLNGDVRLKPSGKAVKSSASEHSVSASSNSETTDSSGEDKPKSPLPLSKTALSSLLSPVHSHKDDWSSPPSPEKKANHLSVFNETAKEEEMEVEEEEEEEEEEGEGEGEGEEEEEEGEGEGEGEEEEEEVTEEHDDAGEVGDYEEEEDLEEEEDDEEEEGRTETEKSGDEKSSLASSEKESSPMCSTTSQTPQQQTQQQTQQQQQFNELLGAVAGAKRKRTRKESEEEYEIRRIARRESLKFVVDFSSQPELVCGERVRLIEEHIRHIQQKWTDLKSEVAYLDRRRRRARRKEREAARILAQVHHNHQSTSTQTSTTTAAIECH